MCLNEKNTWTTSPCKTWESWIISINLSTNSTLQMFCNDFFWVVSDTQNCWKISLALENRHTWIYILTIAFNVNIFIYIFIWFQFTFHNYFWKKFYHSWVVENSSYKIPKLKFYTFQAVMFSAIVNIFCKSSSINHKYWICFLIFTFMSISEAC